MEKGHIGEYTGNNTKLMGSPEIKYGGDIIDETAQDHEGSSLYRKSSSPLNQGQMSMKKVMRSKGDPLHGGDFSDNYSFGDAFAEARSNVGHGGGHFTWQGGKYTTERADDPKFMEGEEQPQRDSISRKSSPLNDMAGGLTHAQMSEKSPENLAGHLKNRDAHKRGVSRKSSPLNADYDKDMAELRIKIKHAKEDIWEDDKKKWENK